MSVLLIGLPKGPHPIHIWSKFAQWFKRRKLKKIEKLKNCEWTLGYKWWLKLTMPIMNGFIFPLEWVSEWLLLTAKWTIFQLYQAKKINMCVYCHMSKKSRVSRSALIFFFFFIMAKTGTIHSEIGFRILFFEISGKPSFVLKLFYESYAVFLPSLLSIRQKASSWINKTLLLIKQQKLLFEFCVKIDRVASKN